MLGSYGYLPNDRRHQFKAFGSYKVFDWMQLGATVIAIAPRKFGCLGTVASSVSSPALIRSGASYDYGYAYGAAGHFRSAEHTSELQSLMRISYAVFCLK